MSDKFFLIFGIVVSLIGLLTVVIEIRTFFTCRMKVTATIVSLKKEATTIRGGKIYSYRPHFIYTVNDKQYDGFAPFSSRKPDKYRVDETLQILVSEKNPEIFRFRGRIGALITGIVVLGIGLLFVILYFI